MERSDGRLELAEQVMIALRGAIAGSEAELRGSLASGMADEFSDIDLLWSVPTATFGQALGAVSAALASVAPLLSLRTDPEFVTLPGKRLIFARLHGYPVWWRIDLEVVPQGGLPEPGGAASEPAATTEWDPYESALLNALAAIKTSRRGEPSAAAGLIRRAADRIGRPGFTGTLGDQVIALADAIVEKRPHLRGFAQQIVEQTNLLADAAGDTPRGPNSPAPLQSESTLASLLRQRASTKSYRPEPLDQSVLQGLLDTAIGQGSSAHRPYGSAHARYDVELTVIAADVAGLEPGAYGYPSHESAWTLIEAGDHRPDLARATLDAPWLTDCPVVLLLAADVDAANDAFAEQGPGRGERFCWIEAGLIAQNVHLWAAERGLGTVFLGGLDHVAMEAATGTLLPSSHTVLGMLPIGRPAAHSMEKE